MRKNKIGAIFLISVLALAGIGISYAGFFDEITVYGSVNNATVDLEITRWYSGTDVWKVYAIQPGTPYPTDEIVIWTGFLNDPERPTQTSLENDWPGCAVELISRSYAKPGIGPFDIEMVYDSLFPCIDFSADFIVHYSGTIPVKVNIAEIASITGGVYPGTEINFLDWLWDYHLTHPEYGAWVESYRAYGLDELGYPTSDLNKIVSWELGEAVDVGYQLHDCNYVYVKLTIHLPQDNNLQGLTGTFGGKIGVIQWNDYCEPCPPPVFTDIDLEIQYEDGWEDVSLISGYFAVFLSGNPDYVWPMNLGTDTTTNIPLAVGYHPFYLEVPPEFTAFWDYWAEKGVVSGATDWQGHMWDIINGLKPIFYVHWDGTGYMLVDGLHRDFIGVDQYFVINDDYPGGDYNVNGQLTSECGSTNIASILIHVYHVTNG